MKIRVASFNVAWAGNDAKRASNSPSLAPLDPERLARSLELLAADVVSFQEIVDPAVLAGALARMSGQPLTIRDADGAEMASRIPDEWDLGAAAFQHVVLGWRPERLQLVRWARLPGKFIREPIAARFATTAGREVVVGALHLKSPSALDGEADAKSKKKRKQECDALHDWLTAAATEDLLAAAGPRAVVAGDLNGTIDGKQQIGAELLNIGDGAGDPALVALRKSLDGWRWQRPGDATGGFAWTTKLDGAIIDHFLASAELVPDGATPLVHLLEKQVEDYFTRVSDHRPVTLDIDV